MAASRPQQLSDLLRGASFRFLHWRKGLLSALGPPSRLWQQKLGLRRRGASDALTRSVPLYRQGKAHYQAREYERAGLAFEQLVQLVPNNGGAWYYLGRIAWINGEHADAAEKFEQAVACSPNNANAVAWLKRAQARLVKLRVKAERDAQDAEPAAEVQARYWPEDEVELDEVLTTAPELVEHPLAFAQRLLADGEPADALAVCDALLADEADEYEVKAVRSRAYLMQGATADALREFDAVFKDGVPIRFQAAFGEILGEIAQTRPEELKRALRGGASWSQIDRLALQLDEANEAMAALALRRAVWIRSGKFDYVKDAVGQLLAAGQGSAAAEFLNDVQAKNPWNKSVYLLQADMFLAQARFPEAKKALLDGIREIPGEASLLIKLAKLFAEQGRWAEAVKAWREAAEAAPRTPGILLEIADCYRKAAQYEKAAQEYRNALSREPGNEKIYRGLSQSLRRLGRQHDAIQVLKKLVEIAPKNFQNWNELIYTLARAEVAQEAEATLAKAEVVLGSDIPTIRKLVLSAERALMTDEAEALLKRVISERPRSPEPVVELGKHYFRQGLLGQADDAFRRSVELGADAAALVHETGHIARVRVLLGKTAGEDLILPEDAIKHIASRRRALQLHPPQTGRAAIITTKLASGGAERQTVITASSVSGCEKVISGVSMHCLSLSSERGHDFYLPLLKDTAVEIMQPCAAELDEALEFAELSEHAELIRLLPPDLAYMVAIWTIDFLRQRPEVVHAWQDSAAIAGALAAILAGVPRVVLSTRNTRPDNKYRRWKRYMFDAYNAFHAQGIVLSNNSKAGGLDYDDWLRLPPGTTEIVYNGVDFSRLDEDRHVLTPQQIKARLGIPEDAMVMGGVFRLSGEKQPLLWVETAALVAKRFPTMHFVICGQGTLRKDILELSARLGIADRLHLPGNQRPIAPWYCAMDVFLLASRKEGLPNVLLEAQYLNVPVVATDVGGVREVMDNEVSGWTVTAQDAEALADRVIFSLEHKAWHENACQAGRAYVKQTFSVQTMTNRTLEVYGYHRAFAAEAA